MAEETRLYGVEDVMERLAVGRSAVFKLISSGELRSITIGRRRLVSEQAIKDFIAQIDRVG